MPNERRITKFLQIVFDALVTVFTFLLAFLGYVRQRPYIVPQKAIIKDFQVGHRPSITVQVANIGHAPAHDMKYGLEIGVLPYPLGRQLPRPTANSIPVEVPPGIPPIGLSGVFTPDTILSQEAANEEVSFFITERQRADLRARGYDDASIDKMTPGEAHKILGIV